MARILVSCAAVLLAGCGAGTHPPKPSPVARAQATHEYRSDRPSPSRPRPAGAAAQLTAIRAFATAYINWTATSVAADMRALARASIGQARSAMELAAAQTAGDYELQRGGIANSGTVEAIAPAGRGHNEFVVVTRELTTATATTAYEGLRPAWHVALATVALVAPGRWALSGWQPVS